MKLRYFTAIITGAQAFMLAVWVMWTCTTMDLIDITVMCLLVYYATVGITLAVTGPRKRLCRMDGPTIITLNKDEWERGKTAKRRKAGEGYEQSKKKQTGECV